LPEVAPPSVADTDTERWLRGELHTHTVHSDGVHTVAELTRRARRLGLDFLALTDHNTLAGHADLAGAALPVLPGVELTTFYGHHVVLGVSEMVPWFERGRLRPVTDVAAAFRRQGALFTVSHPFVLGDPVCAGCRWTARDLDPAHIDLLDVWYRHWSSDFCDNPRALRLWDDLWRRGHRPTGVAARDWHGPPQEVPLPGPFPVTVVRARSTRPADLLAGLSAGAVYLTAGPTLDLTLRTPDGRRLRLGDQGPAGDGPLCAELALSGDLPDHVEPPLRAVLLRCGEPVAEAAAAPDRPLRLQVADARPGWYRVEVRGGREPLVISNHVELL